MLHAPRSTLDAALMELQRVIGILCNSDLIAQRNESNLPGKMSVAFESTIQPLNNKFRKRKQYKGLQTDIQRRHSFMWFIVFSV